MAEIDVYRTYPAPGESWRKWHVYLDDLQVARIGGAGHARIKTDSGSHKIRVGNSKDAASTLEVAVHEDSLTNVLIGLHLKATKYTKVAAAADGAPQAVLASDRSQLPKSAIPLHSSDGREQTLSQGRWKALKGLIVIVGFGLLMYLIAIASFARAAVQHNLVAAIWGVVVLVIALWWSKKLVRPIQLVSNQWSWPLADWRIDHKGEENVEWRRWLPTTAEDSVQAD